jgi:hypothetical protein
MMSGILLLDAQFEESRFQPRDTTAEEDGRQRTEPLMIAPTEGVADEVGQAFFS